MSFSERNLKNTKSPSRSSRKRSSEESSKRILADAPPKDHRRSPPNTKNLTNYINSHQLNQPRDEDIVKQEDASEDSQTLSPTSKIYWDSQIINVKEDATLDWDPRAIEHRDVEYVKEIDEQQEELLKEVAKQALPVNCVFLKMSQINILENCLKTNYVIESQRYPKLYVPPAYMIEKLIDNIRKDIPEITIDSVRIMGGFSSYVMSPRFRYNDLDILIKINFDINRRITVFEKLRSLIIDMLVELAGIFDPAIKSQLNVQDLSQAYIQKSIVVPAPHEKDVDDDCDCWSLVCLRNSDGKNLEFKFVKSMKRHYEFSTDSFQIVLEEDYVRRVSKLCTLATPLAQHHQNEPNPHSKIHYPVPKQVENFKPFEPTFESSATIKQPQDEIIPFESTEKTISKKEETDGESPQKNTDSLKDKPGETAKKSDTDEEEKLKIDLPVATSVVSQTMPLPWCMPQVAVECLYHDLEEALYHLKHFRIKIHNPEGIRGGGLLKYCYLKCIGFVDDPRQTQEQRKKSFCSMVCRFLITCHDPDAQWNAIVKYLQTHFPLSFEERVEYIKTVRSVIEECHVNNLQLVRNLIDVCAKLLEHLQRQIAQMATKQELFNRMYHLNSSTLQTSSSGTNLSSSMGAMQERVAEEPIYSLQPQQPRTNATAAGTVFNYPPQPQTTSFYAYANPHGQLVRPTRMNRNQNFNLYQNHHNATQHHSTPLSSRASSTGRRSPQRQHQRQMNQNSNRGFSSHYAAERFRQRGSQPGRESYRFKREQQDYHDGNRRYNDNRPENRVDRRWRDGRDDPRTPNRDHNDRHDRRDDRRPNRGHNDRRDRHDNHRHQNRDHRHRFQDRDRRNHDQNRGRKRDHDQNQS